MSEKLIHVLNGQIDKMVVGGYLGSVALGFYSVAFQIVLRPVMLINPVLTRVGFPLLSDLQNDTSKARRTYLEMITLISFLCMPLYFGLYAVANPLITIWLGEGWEVTISVFKITVFLGVFIALGNPIGSFLLAKQQVGLSFFMNIYVFAVKFGAILIGLRWGIEGVAWSLLLSMGLALFPLNYLILGKWGGITFKDFTLCWFPYLWMSVLMLAAILLFRLFINFENLYIDLIGSAIIGMIVYTGLMMIFQKKYFLWILSLLKPGQN